MISFWQILQIIILNYFGNNLKDNEILNLKQFRFYQINCVEFYLFVFLIWFQITVFVFVIYFLECNV